MTTMAEERLIARDVLDASTLTFEDGSVIDLAPGVVVRLHAGDRTRWDLDERLRKLFVG